MPLCCYLILISRRTPGSTRTDTLFPSTTLFRSRSVWVVTDMPSVAGVVHDAGVPRMPPISTTHNRQEPNASRLSVAHSFGTSTPASLAARSEEHTSVFQSLMRVSSAVFCLTKIMDISVADIQHLDDRISIM